MAEVLPMHETGTPQNGSSDSSMDELEHEWVFWFSEKQTGKNIKTQDYEQGNKVLGTFKTITDFWRCWNDLDNFQKFPEDSNLKLFKKGVKPTWEDPMNEKGGRWSIFLSKGEKDESEHKNAVIDLWKPMTLALIGEGFCHSDFLTGSIVSLRHKGITLALWVKSFEDTPEVQAEIEKELIEITGNKDWKYQSHEEWSDVVVKFTEPPKPAHPPKYKRPDRASSYNSSDGDGDFIIYTNKKAPATKQKKPKNFNNKKDKPPKPQAEPTSNGSSHPREIPDAPPGFQLKEKNSASPPVEHKVPAPQPVLPEKTEEKPTAPLTEHVKPQENHTGLTTNGTVSNGSHLLAPTVSWGDVSSDEFSSERERANAPKEKTKVVKVNIVLENPEQKKEKKNANLRKAAVQNQTVQNQSQKRTEAPKSAPTPAPKATTAAVPVNYDPRIKPTVSFKDAVVGEKKQEVKPSPTTPPSVTPASASHLAPVLKTADTPVTPEASPHEQPKVVHHRESPKPASPTPAQPSNQTADVHTKVQISMTLDTPHFQEKKSKKNKKKGSASDGAPENTEIPKETIADLTVTVKEVIEVSVKPDKIEEVIEDDAKDVPSRRNSLKKDLESAQELAQMLEKLENQKNSEEKEKKKKKKKKKETPESIAEKEKKKEKELAKELDRSSSNERVRESSKQTVTFPLTFDQTQDSAQNEPQTAVTRERKKKIVKKEVVEPPVVNVWMTREKQVEALLYLLIVALVFFVIIYVMQRYS